MIAYLGTALVAMALLYPVLRLKQADLAVPLYTNQDVYFHAALLKNFVEQGGWYVNPLLGAPGRLELYDFPQLYAAHVPLIRLLALGSRNYAVVMNLFFLAGFPLVAVSALFVWRQLGMSYAAAALGGLLFAYLPFHFLRGESHLFLASYYFVPLALLVAIWVLRGEELIRFGRGWRCLTAKGAGSLVICALLAADNPYFAFFGAFFILVAGLLAVFRYRRRGQAAATAMLLLAVIAVLGLNLLPSFLYHRAHAAIPEATARQPVEAEVYGLKIAQLLLPVSGHRLEPFRVLKDRYAFGASVVRPNEADSATLGLIASVGFCVLLAWVFLGGGRSGEWRESLGLLTLAGVLLGTVGGIGAVFAQVVTPQIRSYTRISVFLAFLGLSAVLRLLEEARPRLPQALWYAGLAALLALGILDQTTPAFVPHYRQIQDDYASDRDFVRRIESSLAPQARIFQLPYLPFPEGPFVNRMGVYDHLRASLHSARLRWSYGSLKYSREDQWARTAAAKRAPELVQALRAAGFSGIYVDRFGYADQAAALESELSAVLGGPPMVSRNQRLAYFPLRR